MGRRRTGRGLIVGACLLTFLGAGCTPDDPPPAPPSTNVPSPSPTENAQEREERLAYEAAEKSYREFRAEFGRILTAGGSERATSLMTTTATGSYLKENLEVVEAYQGLGYHQMGSERIAYVRQAGYSPEAVLLSTCEDAALVKTLDKRGKLVGRGDIRRLDLEIRKSGDLWKVSSGSGRQVKECDD